MRPGYARFYFVFFLRFVFALLGIFSIRLAGTLKTQNSSMGLAFIGIKSVNEKICDLAHFILPDSAFALLIAVYKSR